MFKICFYSFETSNEVSARPEVQQPPHDRKVLSLNPEVNKFVLEGRRRRQSAAVAVAGGRVLGDQAVDELPATLSQPTSGNEIPTVSSRPLTRQSKRV